jgi:hypothetical protein
VLQDFYAKADGSLDYVILSNSTRYYMLLEDESPKTSNQEKWKPITVSDQSHDRSPADSSVRLSPGILAQRVEFSHLLIEGGDISNILFEKIVPKIPIDVTIEIFNEAVQRVEAKLKRSRRVSTT